MTDSDTQNEAADRLAELLTTALLPVAQGAERMDITAATPEQIDLVVELEALSRTISEHSRRVLTGDLTDWTGLADRLSAVARVCRGQVAVDAPSEHGVVRPEQ